ncbi:MAG: LegC family aminotransferase [Candidatus Brevundimonas phytovorans]|nr:LegC family aminotransferase [Brevundimonas sp.]WEK57366.1 MAG: LegC family aminotransferase [Brevundimonas sp.]
MMSPVADALRRFLRDDLRLEGVVPLHSPVFRGNERAYVLDCLDSTFVSSVGEYVTKFENEVARRSGCRFGIATMNGTAAIHALLHAVDVQPDDLVLCPALTFVATVNAILYTGAAPVFLDSDEDTLGLSPQAVAEFLALCEHRNGQAWYQGRRVRACLPVHIFGHVIDIAAIEAACEPYQVIVLEDAAESLGASRNGRSAGSLAHAAAVSFNGNKIVTTGGGGCIVTNDEALAHRLKHLTTTARVRHQWSFLHDEMGFNYRLPNLNAALGLAQMEQLDGFLAAKRALANCYAAVFQGLPDVSFVGEPQGVMSNYWLQAIRVRDRQERDATLEALKADGIEARPVWSLMPDLPHLADCAKIGDLAVARRIEDTLINIPSSPWLMDDVAA